MTGTMAEQGISSFSELIAMPAEELWQMVRNEVKEVLNAPVRVLLSLLGAVLLCAVVCLLVSMNDMAAPSVSLEGKSLWLAQSLPVTAWQVIRAKLRMHLLLTGIPVALCCVCIAIACPFTVAQTALVLAVTVLFTVFSALLCLFLGLKMPNLHWTSEITPIKQGGAVALAMLSGMVYAALLAGGFFLIGWRMGYMAFMAAFAAVTLAACVLLLRWIKTKGCAVFANL